MTLEEDLARRDLTINAMARGEDGRVIDPHGGQADLAAGLLRHVSPAFVEDPLRVLRVARFAARLGFAVAPETEALMRTIVASGELATLAPERIWQELAKGLSETRPSRMLAVLRECGALARVMPELDRSLERPDTPELLAARLDRAAARGYALAVRYALLVLDLGEDGAAALAARIRPPNDCAELALLAIRDRDLVHQCGVDAQSALNVLERADAFRRPDRLDRLVEVAECDLHAGPAHDFVPRKILKRALDAARGVDAGAIAREHPDDIAGAVRRARLVAIAALQPPTGH